ncbi:MAG TPA: ATP-grasp domain-containing protein, partial [Vicinamibacterales bacterium]|nr:ATP-grasp domain-containing protein [Vicinamibacterales bacterium]
DAVLAVGDRPTVLAARAAERLGLRGNPPDAAAATANKREARRRFTALGLQAPWHFAIPLDTDPGSLVSDPRLRFPCVVKPLGLSGSRGVIRADSATECESAFRRIQSLLERPDVREARTGLEDTVLVEGFIPGREWAMEAVLTAGALQVFALFEKPDPLDGPFFEETVYVTPPRRLDRTIERLFTSAVEQAVRALGLTHGPIHAEFRYGDAGVFVLEIASRPIGGLCSRVLRFVNGSSAERISLEEVLLRHALGEDVTAYRRESQPAAVMMIPIPKRGLFKRVDGEAAARAVRHVEDVRITAKLDQLLEPLPEAGSYLGFIFARAATPDAADRAVREAHRELTFTVEPRIDLVPG